MRYETKLKYLKIIKIFDLINKQLGEEAPYLSKYYIISLVEKKCAEKGISISRSVIYEAFAHVKELRKNLFWLK